MIEYIYPWVAKLDEMAWETDQKISLCIFRNFRVCYGLTQKFLWYMDGRCFEPQYIHNRCVIAELLLADTQISLPLPWCTKKPLTDQPSPTMQRTHAHATTLQLLIFERLFLSNKVFYGVVIISYVLYHTLLVFCQHFQFYTAIYAW